MLFKKSFSYKILLFVKGMFMGVANKIPGVSGGAVAYVLGFYDELIYSFQKINGKAFLLLTRGKFKSFYKYINATFLTYLLLGLIFSYFTVSRLLDYFLAHHELEVWSFFFGMIVGSAIYLIKKYKGWNVKSYLFLLVGLLVGFAINFINPIAENHNLWYVFFCGVIGVSGMTIPGLSGSYILMLMGNYVFLLVDAVNVLSDVLLGLLTGNTSLFFDEANQVYLKVIAIFSLGSVAGLIFLSQLLAFVLKKWTKIVNATIIGFIIGSLGVVWPWKEKMYAQKNHVFLVDHFDRKIVIGFQKYFPNMETQENLGALFFMILGLVLVLSLERFSKKN